jgi:hypothetical protein
MLTLLKQTRDWIECNEPAWDEMGKLLSATMVKQNLDDAIQEIEAEGNLTPKLESLMFRAIKTFGTYDPDKIMVLFEEDLNDREYAFVSTFLRWVHINGKTFGSGNIREVLAECESAIGKI